MNIFIFTTSLNDWNSIIIDKLASTNGIYIKGIYEAKSFGGNKGVVFKYKRLLNYGLLNLIRILLQIFNKKKKNNLKNICRKKIIRNNIPLYSEDNLLPYLNIATKEEIDLVLLVYFNRIIPKKYIQKKNKIVNIHPGILPTYRGTQPVFWALLNEDNEIGVSIHKVEEGIDTGDIYYEDKIPVVTKSIYQNMKNLSEFTATLLPNILKDIYEENITAKKQNVSSIYNTRPNYLQIKKFLKMGNRYY